MAWYRNLTVPDGDPRGVVTIAGSHPGEVFSFDYDRPGYNVAPLIAAGMIEPIQAPTKDELVMVAKRLGLAGADKMTKEQLEAALTAGEE